MNQPPTPPPAPNPGGPPETAPQTAPQTAPEAATDAATDAAARVRTTAAAPAAPAASTQPKIDLFGAARGRFGAIVGLALLGSALSVAQLVAIVHLTRALWPGVTGGQIDAGRVWWAVGAAAAALVGAFAASGAATLAGHLA
ncbi:MAG: hypothetical protein LBD90_08075, partial [Bifidobacteriaceae bacterium]|nr:hypothetical protein [Bifidobacteriaceae bacterium]